MSTSPLKSFGAGTEVLQLDSLPHINPFQL